MSRLTAVGPLESIPRLGARVVQVGSTRFALFRTAEDEIFALEDRCPHRGGPLSQGIVHGCRVTCPLHNMVIDLATGSAVAPDEGNARTVPVTVDNGQIFLALDLQAGGATAAVGPEPARA